MTKILLIRHALTDSVGKRISGRAPGLFLNETGQKQANELAGKLASTPLSAIYSSPLERTVETADTIARFHKLECITLDYFTEIDFGEWTGLTMEELSKDLHFHRFNNLRSNIRIPGGETMLEAQLRAVKGLQELTLKHPNQTIAVVSHGDIIRSAMAYYSGIHLDFMLRLEISPASVSILEIFDDAVRILQVNGTYEIN